MRLERFWNGVKKRKWGVDRENESLKWVKIMYQTCFLFLLLFFN